MFEAGPVNQIGIRRFVIESSSVHRRLVEPTRPPHETFTPERGFTLLDFFHEHIIEHALFAVRENVGIERDRRFVEFYEMLEILPGYNACRHDDLPAVKRITGKNEIRVEHRKVVEFEVMKRYFVQGIWRVGYDEVFIVFLQNLEDSSEKDNVAVDNQTPLTRRQEHGLRFPRPNPRSFRSVSKRSTFHSFSTSAVSYKPCDSSLIRLMGMVGYQRRMLATQHLVNSRSRLHPAT